MRAPRSTPLAVGLALALTACSSTGEPPVATPTPTGSTTVSVSGNAPHVEGPLELVVRPGFRVVTADACTPDVRIVCSPNRAVTYRVFGKRHRVELGEARTDLNDDSTAWSATLTFARDARRPLRRAGDMALANGGTLLVLGGAGEVLLDVPPDAVERGRVQLVEMDKRDAWALVESIAAE